MPSCHLRSHGEHTGVAGEMVETTLLARPHEPVLVKGPPVIAVSSYLAQTLAQEAIRGFNFREGDQEYRL